MKNWIKKYKEMIIAFLIITMFIIIVGVNFKINDKKEYDFQDKMIDEQVEEVHSIAKNAYYVKDCICQVKIEPYYN